MKLYSYLLIFSFFLVGCQDKPKIQSETQQKETLPIVQNLIPFENQSSGLWGYRNQDTGDVVIETKYDEVGEFSDSFSSVRIGKKWGVINQKGKMIIKPKFDSVGGLSEGLF